VRHKLSRKLPLAIGLGLLARSTVRPALVASFAWSLAVWWIGEGFGGLLTGTASPLSGAPGAVLLYIFVGLLAWPRVDQSHEMGAVRSVRLLGERWARAIWAVLWVGCAALLLQPANLAGGALRATLVAAKEGQPGWYARVLSNAAHVLGPYGVALTIAVAAEMAVVGIGVALEWRVPALLGVATVLALLIWAFPEGLGGILTGAGTDPNTGPLLALAALAWYHSRLKPQACRALVPTSVGVAP